MLISSYDDRMQRAINKKKVMLRFLRDETWTHVSNIQRLLSVNYVTAHQVLTKLKKQSMLKSHQYHGLGGRITLWGITAHGLAMSYEDEEPLEKRPCFDSSKITLSTVNHTLGIQQAHIQAEKVDWTHWTNGKHLSGSPSKRPDAVAINPDQKKVAIEIELTIKTRKRYEQIMTEYLKAIKKEEYDHVVYLSTGVITPRLEKFFRQIREVPVNGQRVSITDKHHSKFVFYTLDNWPQAN